MNHLENICYVKGKISSNPVKNLTNGSYSFSMKLYESGENLNGNFVKSSGNGTIDVNCKAEIVENINPGKLFSVSDGFGIFEKGEEFQFNGYYSVKKQKFVVQSSV